MYWQGWSIILINTEIRLTAIWSCSNLAVFNKYPRQMGILLWQQHPVLPDRLGRTEKITNMMIFPGYWVNKFQNSKSFQISYKLLQNVTFDHEIRLQFTREAIQSNCVSAWYIVIAQVNGLERIFLVLIAKLFVLFHAYTKIRVYYSGCWSVLCGCI